VTIDRLLILLIPADCALLQRKVAAPTSTLRLHTIASMTMTSEESSTPPESSSGIPTEDLEPATQDAPQAAAKAVDGVPEAASKSLIRKSSVSEAAEISSGGIHAPWFLSWIEYPFHISDPTTGKMLPEVAGQGMDAAARGPLNQVGGYVGSAIVRLAARDAGCRFGPGRCDKTVYGIQPSSLLTTTSAISGVCAALLMPVFGAMIDHTEHRRLLGVISGFMAVAAVGAQISISQSTWFFVLWMDAIGGFSLLVHAASVLAYLPDLTLDYAVLSHYTSRINIRQFSIQFVYLSIVIIIGQVRDLDRTIESSVQTARDSAGLAFGIGALCIPYAWMFLFRKRPALSKVPEDSNLLNTGFKQVARTSKKIWKDYRALKWFMISLLWSPEAGAGVVQSIAVTFLTVVMRFSGLEIAKANLILISANLPGSMFSKWCCAKINPLNSYRGGLLLLIVSIAVACVVLEGPDNRDAVYGFSAAWGFAMGWTYPSQRVLLVSLIPKGQETEMMGLFTFVGQILGWLPPLIFTIMNEKEIDQRWGLGLVPMFCTLALLCTVPMGSYEDAIERVSKDSEAKLEEVIEATRRGQVLPQSFKDTVRENEESAEVDEDAEVETAEAEVESSDVEPKTAP
jgi:MFS-type transporter involved in bile tolerance (Atg22 family)